MIRKIFGRFILKSYSLPAFPKANAFKILADLVSPLQQRLLLPSKLKSLPIGD
jgi:hypothetical protein